MMSKPLVVLLLVALLAAGCAYAESVPITASKDADVKRDDPTDKSGSDTTLFLQDKETQEQDCYLCGFFSTCCDPPYTIYSEILLYYGFDLSQIAGKCLQSATLELTMNPSYGSVSGSGNLIYVRRTSSSWTESSMNYNTKAAVLDEAVSAQLFSLVSSKYILNVPVSFLESAIASADKTLSLQVELNNGGASTVSAGFYSKESSTLGNRPILRVSFATCGNNTYCSSGTCPCQSGFVPTTTPNNCIDFDDCSVTPFPCNNGACANDGAGTGRVNCTCNSGWQGSKCNVDIDECSLNLCGSHAASCANSPGSFACTCDPFWTGPTCTQDKLECATNPCKNGGTCNEKIGANFTCTCATGFAGDVCEVAIQSCTNNPCKNGGNCSILNVNAIQCQCASGYDGTLCENNINDCPLANPCQNGGTCLDNATVANAYYCSCPPGYTGEGCEIDIDFCANNKCQNGATCNDGILTFTCTCPPGYQGLFCQDDVPECSYNPCLNGNCTEAVGSFSCSCKLGWGGPLCDTAVYCDVDYDQLTTNWPRTRAGETALGTCKAGYQASSPSRPCNQPSNNGVVGVWGTVLTACEAKICASLSSTRTTWPPVAAGTNATGTCKDGFASEDFPVRYCDQEGVFSSLVWNPCEPTYCPATSFGNANFTSVQSGKGSVGICLEGFVGSPLLNCSLTAEWGAEVTGLPCTAASGPICPATYITVSGTQFLQFPPTQAGQQASGRCAPGLLGTPKRSCDSTGNWGAITSPCQQLPGPVVNLTVAEKNSKSVLLKWSPGVNNTLYRITFSKDGGTSYSIVSNGYGDNYVGTSIQVDFLEPDTLHIFKVYGGNTVGYEESGSSISVITSLPVADNFTSIATNTTVSIKWKPAVGVEWYNIYARLVPDSKRNTGIVSTTFVLVDGGYRSTHNSYNFTSLVYASRYEAKIVSGKTQNGNDVFDEKGVVFPFETLGRIAPTPPPTPTPDTPTSNPKDLIPAIAGGVSGAVILILFVVILIAFYVRSKRKEKELYELQMSDLPPTSAGWAASGTSLIDRAGGTKTLTRTHTLTRPNGDILPQPGVSLHSLGSTPGEFGAEPTLMNTIMEIALPGFLLLDYAKDLRIQNRFGNGGSGVVYRAVLLDPKLRKQHGVEEVAIKEVVAWDKLSEEENMERFHQEVSLLWSLAFHRNIATLIGYTDSPPTIVTKLYETDLFQFIQNPDEDVDSSLAVMLAGQVAAGLSAMHNIGIIHRDIKSANVLLETVSTENGILLNACICDFGIARVTTQSRLFNQKFSTVVGLSPRYAAPEVFARSHLPTLVPDPEEEKKADVFAFGVVIWELLALDVPWGDTPNEQIEVRVRSGKRLDLPPNENNDPLRQVLMEICQACWVEATVKRPSIQDISARLNSIEL